jgi:hypothetical protein
VPTATQPVPSVPTEQPPVVVAPTTSTTTTVVVDTTVTFDTAPPADAPIEVREQFENSVDLFSGDFDEYVQIGSTVTVAQRRVVIAATTVMFVLPAATTARRRNK